MYYFASKIATGGIIEDNLWLRLKHPSPPIQASPFDNFRLRFPSSPGENILALTRWNLDQDRSYFGEALQAMRPNSCSTMLPDFQRRFIVKKAQNYRFGTEIILR